MKRVQILAAALLLAAGAPRAGAAEPPKAGASARVAEMQAAAAGYLEAKTDAERKKLAPALAAFKAITKAEFAAVVEWLKARGAAAYPPAKPGRHVEHVTFRKFPGKAKGSKDDVDVKLAYHVYLPRGYDPRKAYPCMIYLGSQFGTGNGGAFRKAAPGWIGMGVTKHLPYYSGRGLTPINGPLEDALRRFHIDPDRVYIGGYSAGGAYGLTEASFNPDFYAGMLSCSGHSGRANLYNVFNLGIYLLHGEKDFNLAAGKRIKSLLQRYKIRHKLVVVPGQGHSSCQGQWGEVKTWFEANPRPTYPRNIQLKQKGWPNPKEPRRGWMRHFWTYGYVRAKSRHKLFEITGGLRGQNVSVSIKGLDGLEVYLNDQMVDLDKPVGLRVARQSVARKFERSLRVLLDYHRAEPRSGFYFAARYALGPPRQAP